MVDILGIDLLKSKSRRFELIILISLCLIMLIAPFARGAYPEQILYPFLATVALLFVFFLVQQFKAKEPGFFNNPLDWAILALLIAYTLSLIVAIDFRSGIVGVMKYAACVMVFWMCYRVALREEGYLTLITTIYITGVAMALVGILIYCNILHYPFFVSQDRIWGTLEYPNTFGAYVAVISILGWGLSLIVQNKFMRPVLAGCNVILLIAMLGSLSRGAWLIYPIAVLVYILVVGKGRRLDAILNWLVFLIPSLFLGRLLLSHSAKPSAFIYIIIGIGLAVIFQLGRDYLTKAIPNFNIKSNRLIIGGIVSIVLLLGMVLTSSALQTFFTQSSLSRLTDISIEDRNVQQRIEYSRATLKIVKDYPIIGVGAGGWAALYHQYASHLYWSDKAHNFFLQTWLETGTLGFLALIAMFIFFIHLLWVVWKRENIINYSPLFWSIAVSVFFLAAHSLIDFDMSYPAISTLFFGLIGAIKGQSLSKQENLTSVADIKPNKKKHKNREALSRFNREFGIAIVLGVIVSTFLIITSACYFTAGMYFRTAQNIINQDHNQFIVELNNAIKLDPYNANYYEQGAVFWAAITKTTKNAQYYQQCIAFSDKALELAPYNLRILNNINDIYVQFGETERTLNLGELYVKANPQDPVTWEILANHYVSIGEYYLDQGQIDKARSSWENALKVKERVPSNLDPPAIGLNYTSGTALLLLGQKQQGEQALYAMLTESELSSSGATQADYIERANKIRNSARVWLAASLEYSGNQVEANKIFNQLPDSEKEAEKASLEKIKTWFQKLNVPKS
jgi:O-antigen ligase